MDWLGDLIGVGANVASGGVVGIIGSLAGGVVKLFQARAERKAREQEMAHELRLLDMQQKARREETEQELLLAQATSDGAARAASYDLGMERASTYRWIDGLRSLFRPFLTLALWGLSGWIFVLTIQVLDNDGGRLASLFSFAEAADLIRYQVQNIVFCASMATAWWFGDRALTPPGRSR